MLDFTFGPRGRLATRSVRFPWVRILLSIATGLALGLMLLAAMGILTPAHAATLNQTQELKAAAERLNDTCRDDPKAAGACAARDGVLAQLKSAGQCWNSKAPTPETLWVRCEVKASADPCEAWGNLAYTLAAQRDAGVAPKQAYAHAVQQADSYGMNPGPLQALTWRVYAELGYVAPSSIRYASRYECRRNRGVL